MAKKLNQMQKVVIRRRKRRGDEEDKRISNKIRKTRLKSLTKEFYKSLSAHFYLLGHNVHRKKFDADNKIIINQAMQYRRDIMRQNSHCFSLKEIYQENDINNQEVYQKLVDVESHLGSMYNKNVIKKNTRSRKISTLFRIFRVTSDGVKLCLG